MKHLKSLLLTTALTLAGASGALAGEADGGGLLAYNYLSGEPITALAEGRPLVVRTPDSSLTLANFMRAQLYGVFATLSLGMRTLAREGAHVDVMVAHGGLFFRTINGNTSFSITGEGARFLRIQPVNPEPAFRRIELVLGWFSGLKRGGSAR